MFDKTEGCVLAVDIGSSSVKGALFSTSCRLIPDTFFALEHKQTNSFDGGVEENPLYIQKIVENVIDKIVNQINKKNYEILAVAIDSMASTVSGLNKLNDPVTPFYTYADTRNSYDVEKIKESINELEVHQRTGTMQHTSYLPARIMWIKRTKPELYTQISKWVDIPTFLFMRWFEFEKVKTSYCLASWSGLVDRFNRRWDESILNLLDMDKNYFPELSTWDDSIQILNKEYSKRWKPLRNIPFFLGVGDGLSANLGTGCVDPSNLAITIGSTGAMRTILPGNPKIPLGLWSYCFGKDKNILGGSFTEGGNVIKWANDNLGLDTSSGLDKILNGRAPDIHGLTVLPFLSGERSTGWNGAATASISGIRMSTSSTDILQALCESIAHRFSDVLDLILPYLDKDLNIVASGGALSESKWWLKTISNSLGRPIMVCDLDQQTLYGTSKLALKGIGVIGNFEEIPVEKSDIIYPDYKAIEIMKVARLKHKDFYNSLFG